MPSSRPLTPELSAVKPQLRKDAEMLSASGGHSRAFFTGEKQSVWTIWHGRTENKNGNKLTNNNTPCLREAARTLYASRRHTVETVKERLKDSKIMREGEKVKEENIYKKNEYIVIKGEIFKITGVNTNKSTLVLEKPDLPKEQLFSTQTGNKPYPFQGEDFTTKEVISLEILKGKYVFLDFWAESCGSCIKEFPFLKELYANIDRAKFEIIGIAGHSSFNGVNRLIKQHGLTWPNIFDDTNKIVNSYGIIGYPTTLLLNTEGIIIAKNLSGEKLQEKILGLIGE